jgi:predicted kinase
MAKIILIRGLPGAGKSTYAKQFGIYHLEADMFFVKDGKYQWSANQIGAAHEWCFKSFCVAVDNNMDVVVSNTFVTLKEMQRYLDFASMNGIEVEVFKMINNYGSIHNVPEETLNRMRKNFEKYDGETEVM